MLEVGLIVKALFLFWLAIVFAALEVEVEGKNGWAEKGPTWYRRGGLYGRLMGGKPLTGYHLWMFQIPTLMFHIPFFLGLGWNISRELEVLAASWAFTPLWDFLWFVLNPYYTIKNFRPEKIWWHKKWFGPVPKDYYFGLGISALLAFAASGVSRNWNFLTNHLLLLVFFCVLTGATVLAAPRYHRWYHKMREKDDRGEAGIFH